MLPSARLLLIASAWMLSFTLLVVRTVMRSWESLAVLSAWSLWIGMVALALTGWHLLTSLLVKERARVESIAEQAAEVAIRHSGLDSIG